jgi:hypothetical protein
VIASLWPDHMFVHPQHRARKHASPTRMRRGDDRPVIGSKQDRNAIGDPHGHGTRGVIGHNRICLGR